MDTKLIQNTKSVYLYSVYKDCTKQILYDNECTSNVHQILTYIQKIYKLHRTCTKFKL